MLCSTYYGRDSQGQTGSATCALLSRILWVVPGGFIVVMPRDTHTTNNSVSKTSPLGILSLCCSRDTPDDARFCFLSFFFWTQKRTEGHEPIPGDLGRQFTRAELLAKSDVFFSLLLSRQRYVCVCVCVCVLTIITIHKGPPCPLKRVAPVG